MIYDEDAFFEHLRAVADSGSGKVREVRCGRVVADAHRLVKDRDDLISEVKRLESENARLHSIITKLA